MADTGSFGTITTCRASAKQMREFVNYHLNLGATCMVIYFDDPDDPAIDLFRNEERVVCRACTEAHWYSLLGRRPAYVMEAQIANIEDGSAILRQRGVSWIASIDADELLYSPTPIAPLLSSIDPSVDIVLARPMEAIQHKDMREALEFRSHYFRKLTRAMSPAQVQAARRHMRGVLEFGEAGCFGHLQGKSLFRASAKIDNYGIHKPKNSRLRRIESQELVLLHFDALNYEIWETRWLRRITGESVHSGISDRRVKQHHYIKQRYDAEGKAGMRRLFRQWHVYSPSAVTALQKVRLLRRIRIPSSSFGGPIK